VSFWPGFDKPLGDSSLAARRWRETSAVLRIWVVGNEERKPWKWMLKWN